MKQAITILILLVVLVGGGCANQLERPDVIVTNVTPLESTMFEQRVQVDLRIINPNEKELEVNGLDFKLDVNGSRLVRGVSDQAVFVPGLGEGVMSVNASTSLFDLVRQTLILAESENAVLAYELYGGLHLSNFAFGKIKFSTAGELSPDSFGGANAWLTR